MDVSKICKFSDYFVICSAETTTQTKSILQEILKKSKEFNYDIHHYETDNNFKWILIDFFDVVLHIFTDEARSFYSLEHLWHNAKRVRISKIKK